MRTCGVSDFAQGTYVFSRLDLLPIPVIADSKRSVYDFALLERVVLHVDGFPVDWGARVSCSVRAGV